LNKSVLSYKLILDRIKHVGGAIWKTSVHRDRRTLHIIICFSLHACLSTWRPGPLIEVGVGTRVE